VTTPWKDVKAAKARLDVANGRRSSSADPTPPPAPAPDAAAPDQPDQPEQPVDPPLEYRLGRGFRHRRFGVTYRLDGASYDESGRVTVVVLTRVEPPPYLRLTRAELRDLLEEL
jgi:hypothetical protein